MRSYLFLFSLFLSASLFSQDTLPPSKFQYTIGYFGETVTHAGFNLGLERQLSDSEKYQIILAVNAGYYKHIRNNTSIFLRAQWGQRINFTNGVFIDHFLGVGYLHQFVSGGDIYEVLPNGAVVESPNTGSPKFMPSIAVGAGYNFPESRFSLYVRPELFWKAPFNGYFLTNFALNAGVIIKMK